jgi:hypothetical protein
MRAPRFWPKVPPNTAPGFYQAVHKYFIVVELLMVDIPDRSLFRHVILEKALTAYLDIVKGNFYLPHSTTFDNH